MAQGPYVQVKGLDGLVKGLRRVSKQLPKEVRAVNYDVARDVVTRARGKAESLGGVHKHARMGIRAGASAKAGKITLLGDNPRYAMVLGAEFGGGRRARTRQFPQWRGSGKTAGYFLYPTLWDQRHDIAKRYDGLVDEVLRRNQLA